jgi:predicted nucleic acid-binding protein
VTGELLLDTGALVSLLDRGQAHHAACRRVYEEWAGSVVSTEAVLTEATHLLGRIDGGVAACLDFFSSKSQAITFQSSLLTSSSADCQRWHHSLWSS